MHLLAFDEIDAGDLPLDLGAYDVCVVGDHSADADKIHRDVVLSDGRSDDRHRSRRSRRGCGLLQWLNVQEVKKNAGRDDTSH